jgi:hypothetical protein
MYPGDIAIASRYLGWWWLWLDMWLALPGYGCQGYVRGKLVAQGEIIIVCELGWTISHCAYTI